MRYNLRGADGVEIGDWVDFRDWSISIVDDKWSLPIEDLTANHVGALPISGGALIGPITAPNFAGPLSGNANTATTASNMTLHSLPAGGTMSEINRNGFSQGNNLTDRPPQQGHQWDYIQSYRHNDTHRLLIVTDFKNSRTAQKSMDSGVWRDWKYQLFIEMS